MRLTKQRLQTTSTPGMLFRKDGLVVGQSKYGARALNLEFVVDGETAIPLVCKKASPPSAIQPLSVCRQIVCLCGQFAVGEAFAGPALYALAPTFLWNQQPQPIARWLILTTTRSLSSFTLLYTFS
ncbi:hypothetical protein RUM43_014795 [Polyplax serrata]|uniref:Uncharacterized protein n=1 Tax=Polyplax serrata TaxID=468196 RepID=A0AAN8P3Z0_POLSC